MKQLVIIPGLGDGQLHRLYQKAVQRFAHTEFNPQLFVFGWDDRNASFTAKMERFLKFIDSFDPHDELYLIGISAGGTAAIIALAERPHIHKVIVIATPLRQDSPSVHVDLAHALPKTQHILELLSPDQKDKILSIAGLYDGRVHVDLSHAEGLATLRILSVFHLPTIAVALLCYRRHILRFFNN